MRQFVAILGEPTNRFLLLLILIALIGFNTALLSRRERVASHPTPNAGGLVWVTITPSLTITPWPTATAWRAGQPTPVPIATPWPTATPMPWLPTSTPWPTNTATLIPTSTPWPTSSPTVIPTSTPWPTVVFVIDGASCACVANLYNCEDFHGDGAQICLAKCWTEVGADIHDLDRNHNGVACENER